MQKHPFSWKRCLYYMCFSRVSFYYQKKKKGCFSSGMVSSPIQECYLAISLMLFPAFLFDAWCFPLKFIFLPPWTENQVVIWQVVEMYLANIFGVKQDHVVQKWACGHCLRVFCFLQMHWQYWTRTDFLLLEDGVSLKFQELVEQSHWRGSS